MFLKCLIVSCLFLRLAGHAASEQAVALGFLQGHLRIVSAKPVELADGNGPTVTAETFAEYPLIVLNHDTKKEVFRFIADKNGNYRVALPPGTYVLDVQDRVRKHVRAKPQQFTVVSNETVRVNMDMDTGVR